MQNKEVLSLIGHDASSGCDAEVPAWWTMSADCGIKREWDLQEWNLVNPVDSLCSTMAQ